MALNTGFFDGLFGEKVELEVSQSDGTTKKISVTKAWLRRMESEGKISTSEPPPQTIDVHYLGPDGVEVRKWRIGSDISEADHRRKVDSQSGLLYGLIYFEEGIERSQIVPRQAWEAAKAHSAVMELAAEKLIAESIRTLGDAQSEPSEEDEIAQLEPSRELDPKRAAEIRKIFDKLKQYQSQLSDQQGSKRDK